MEINELLLNRKANVINEGTTSLHVAVEKGSLHIVERLLKAGAYVDSVSPVSFKKGYTPLCVAVYRGDEEITKLLLSSGANVNVNVVDGETPLHIAVGEGHLQIVEYLLQHGANVDSECSLGGANRSYTPLRRAIWQQNVRIVELLLKYGANVDAEMEGGETILQSAVESENPKIIDHILKYCPDVNNEGNKSALNTAVCEYGKGYPQIVENMLQYGFTINPDVQNFYELLHAAVTKGYLKIVEELLIHGTDVNTCGTGNTLLHIAIKSKQEEIAKLLVSYASDVNVKDDSGKTPIFYATENGDLKMIELLLTYRASVKDDSELLFTAVQNKKGEILKLLLSNGANVNARSQNGDTALHIAAASGYVKVVEALLEYNVDVNSTIKYYITPLHISAQEGTAVINKMLLSRGANVNAMQADGTTALHIATREGHKEVVEVLLRCGAKVDSRIEKFMTPLHIAAENIFPEVAEILLKFGANTDSLDKFGRTALHIASKAGHEEIVTNLLKYGSDVNIESKKSHTPLDSALSGIATFSNMQYARDYDPSRYCSSVIVRGIYTCKIIYETLLLHIVKMKTANLYVSERNSLAIHIINSLNYIQNECKKEIAYMKNQKINNTNVSYYDILTKDINRLAMYVRNENIVRVFRSDDYKNKFPMYVNLLESNFRKGKIRTQLLEQSNQCFLIPFDNIPQLPYNCTEKIFHYLSDEDLTILISAFGKVEGRKELLEQGYRFFYLLLNDSLEVSYDCAEKIFSYLGDEDLRILIEACKPTNIGSPNIDNNDVTMTLNVPKSLQALPYTRKRKRE